MMKKILITIFLFFTYASFCQTWFDIGVKTGVGAGFLLNQNINNDIRLDLSPGFNSFVGGKVGVNFGEKFGVALDVDFGTYVLAFNQSKVPTKDQSKVYKLTFGYQSLNIMPTFRYTKEASYLELGPQFSFVKNQILEDESGLMSPSIATESINPNLTGVVFGFGGHMIGTDAIALMVGLRFNYRFSNFTSYTYEATSFPFTNYSDISASKTTQFNAQIILELNYSLGYIVKASCGRRTAFLSF